MEHIISAVNRNHRTTRSGSKRGGIQVTAKAYGVPAQELSNVINDCRPPTPRILKHEKLQAITVYVPISEEGR